MVDSPQRDSDSGSDSVDEAEVERIFRERQLQKQAQEEIEEQKRQEKLTSQEVLETVDQAD